MPQARDAMLASLPSDKHGFTVRDHVSTVIHSSFLRCGLLS